MSFKISPNCIKVSAIAGFLLLFQPGRAQQPFAAVSNWLEAHTPEMGGRAILLVYKDGQVVYEQAYNEMSGRQRRMGQFLARKKGESKSVATGDYTRTTRQPIASCSKWLSAALVMTFVDEGKLSLSDTVGRFLPILSQNGKGKITIQQCLSHLTGIAAPELKESLEEMKNFRNMDDAIAALAALPMEGEPGKVFHYSNAGLQIAGAVLEKISGKSFETLFAERIARPLDMRNTDFGHKKVPLPAGGASATPEDYLHFLVMILDKGRYNGRQVLSATSVAAMQVNLLDKNVRIAHAPAEAGNFGYGLGEWVMNTGTPGSAVTSPGLFGSFPWVDNEKHYCAFLMCNYLKSDGRHERYKALKALVDAAVQ